MPTSLPALAFGGDYNPEQWPAAAHVEDRELMGEAGVDLVTLAVFSWAWLQPGPGQWEFGWLDRQMDDLHAAGIKVDLATATASPPPWLTHRHPEMLPVTVDGRTLWPGGRQSFCPSSPVYREHALELCTRMAERSRDHPALALWHVSNELGCHNARCYCDTSAAAFRTWLRARYGDIDALNEAWGTAFWSQTYTDWAQVQPPRATPTSSNPGQVLDFRRFSSDEHLACFTAERDVLHRRVGVLALDDDVAAGHDRIVPALERRCCSQGPLGVPRALAFCAAIGRRLRNRVSPQEKGWQLPLVSDSGAASTRCRWNHHPLARDLYRHR